jgi:hypothetical protein
LATTRIESKFSEVSELLAPKLYASLMAQEEFLAGLREIEGGLTPEEAIGAVALASSSGIGLSLHALIATDRRLCVTTHKAMFGTLVHSQWYEYVSPHGDKMWAKSAQKLFGYRNASGTLRIQTPGRVLKFDNVFPHFGASGIVSMITGRGPTLEPDLPRSPKFIGNARVVTGALPFNLDRSVRLPPRLGIGTRLYVSVDESSGEVEFAKKDGTITGVPACRVPLEEIGIGNGDDRVFSYPEGAPQAWVSFDKSTSLTVLRDLRDARQRYPVEHSDTFGRLEPTRPSNDVERLENLLVLLNCGLLTEEEYQRKRSAIIEGL